jgi:transcriptional regulator with XRE-family HTH domain
MRIKEIRQEHHLKQREVAEALYIPVRTYQNYERGVNCPDVDMLILMADFYQVSIDELVGHESPLGHDVYSLAQDEQLLLRFYRSMSDDQKRNLVAYLKQLNLRR